MSMLHRHITKQLPTAPLVTFRVVFGAMMVFSIVRFAWNGWINSLYIEPTYFFSYYGFEWVRPLGETGMYILFFVMGLSALGVCLGLFYRFSSIMFFVTFTYVELIDKTNYLNHYYFVSLVAFLMIFLPAHRYFSLDAWRRPAIEARVVPAWTINIIKFQLAVVYFYAGIAKLNSFWLVEAMPLKIWLPAHSGLPVIGWIFDYELTAYLFSWGGALYDITIVFFLLCGVTRIYAYGAVVFFHLMTALLFQIGMFPYIMMASTLIFFSAHWHQQLIEALAKRPARSADLTGASSSASRPVVASLLVCYVVFQLVFPFRYLAYPGNLFWTEEGYRFSWRVMLMEKAGYTVFNIEDLESGKKEQVMNYQYLTQNQEKMMSTQPDMILQFAHFLGDEYKRKGFKKPKVTAESYVTLNCRRSRSYIDPEVDLTLISDSFAPKNWIMPFENQPTALR